MLQRISGVQQEEALDSVWFAYSGIGLAVGFAENSVDSEGAVHGSMMRVLLNRIHGVGHAGHL